MASPNSPLSLRTRIALLEEELESLKKRKPSPVDSLLFSDAPVTVAIQNGHLRVKGLPGREWREFRHYCDQPLEGQQ